MCSKELAAGHQHLLDPVNRKLICACDACAILFDSEGHTKYKRVPRRVRYSAGLPHDGQPMGRADDAHQHGFLF